MHTIGGIGFDGEGEHLQPCPPQWVTLYMEHFMQIMDDSKQWFNQFLSSQSLSDILFIETMVKICFCLNVSTRLQGIIKNKSASGSRMLSLVIFDKKSASFFQKLCYFKVFLGITLLKVPFLKDFGCCPKILDYTLDLHWHAPQTQINLYDFMPWRLFLN